MNRTRIVSCILGVSLIGTQVVNISQAMAYSYYPTSISLNGTVMSKPMHMIAFDGYSDTSFVPVWYMNQVLSSIGISADWNGVTGVLNLVPSADFSADLSSLPMNRTPSTGEMSFAIHGTNVEYAPRISAPAPDSGVQTTYVPIYYLEKVLVRFGIYSTWTGSAWSMTYEVPLTGQTNRPFPQHVMYTSGSIVPDKWMQPQLDSQVEDFYNYWKSKYLIHDPSLPNADYIYHNIGAPDIGVSVSEGQGYGMVISALMAGYDSNAHQIFDDLYRFYKAHTSVNNSALMAWQQIKDSSGHIIDNPDGGRDSATDGDMDIAYGLLLAANQWGNSGPIQYRDEAIKVMSGIMKSDVNHTTWTLELGDWVDPADASYGTGTRFSDYMLDHLKAFATVTQNSDWNKVIQSSYDVVNSIVAKYSPNTGLLPDFAYLQNGQFTPVGANYLESQYDGAYNWNSCRVPWRLSTDYLVTGDTRAYSGLKTLNNWFQMKTNSVPGSIVDGYQLNGQDFNETDRTINNMAFVAPLAVSAAIDKGNQAWLDNIWTDMLQNPRTGNDYFGDTIQLQAMIVVSRNWWMPD